MNFKVALLITLSVLVFSFSCTPNKEALQDKFKTHSARIAKEQIPDLALDVFHAQLLRKNNEWTLSGETTSAGAYKNTLLLADSLLGANKYINDFMLLPDSSLGDSLFGIVKIAVANLRRRPKAAAELIDQTILGRPLQLLKRKKSWYLVKTHYGYTGWTPKYSLLRTDRKTLAEWENAPLLRVKSLWTIIHRAPSAASGAVARAPLNSALRLIGRKGNWVEVALPDQRTGYVHKTEVAAPGRQSGKKICGQEIVKTARRMIGVPYLWGGKSSTASDCSGFTQTVFKAHGIQLPRDARQQALEGKEVKPDSTFSNVKAGDLLFFGLNKRITHVGISLGAYDFIHQDSEVHIDSFDEKAQNYNAFRKKSLKIIKRIIKE